ncbi:MAG: sulfotransferase [Sandaracinaceae bacterium]
MSGRLNRIAVSIAGAGHSGSTLLGLVLGAHSECVYLGEAKKSDFLFDEDKPLRKRVCKICGPDCELWSRFTGPEPDLYEALSRLTGRAVVIDSSKDVGWIRARRAEVVRAGGRHRVLFLTRDGRAVINSRARKYGEEDASELIDEWLSKIEQTQALVREVGPDALQLRYEELATEPERTMRRVCEHVGIEYEPDMLLYEGTLQHPLGGNTGTQSVVARANGADARFAQVPERSRDFYDALDGGFALDLRWQSELDADLLRRFEARAGDVNEAFRWDASGADDGGGVEHR